MTITQILAGLCTLKLNYVQFRAIFALANTKMFTRAHFFPGHTACRPTSFSEMALDKLSEHATLSHVRSPSSEVYCVHPPSQLLRLSRVNIAVGWLGFSVTGIVRC